MYALLHDLNEETIKCKKHLGFSTSKNSVSMSPFSAKENANVEGKSENKTGIQHESQRRENFIDFFIQFFYSNFLNQI